MGISNSLKATKYKLKLEVFGGFLRSNKIRITTPEYANNYS